MSDRFLSRQLLQLGLVGNALRPLPGPPASIPAFFSGWLTAELAPHLIEDLSEVARRDRRPLRC